MWLLLQIFWWTTVAELCAVVIPSLWWQKRLAPIISVVLLVSAGGLLVDHPSIPTILLFIITAYRIVNLWRLVRARMHEKYLRRATRQASLWLIATQIAVFLIWEWTVSSHISTYRLWLAVMAADALCALVLLASTVRHIRTTRMPQVKTANHSSEEGLPTLTVAIPARNETDDLKECLTSVIASDYPKLEILVLDDCSQNRHTPEIIRSFAHAGVRFIQGRPTEDNWLAKNQAYQQLLDESNGELVLFCGVDVRFRPSSIRLMVEALLQKKKSMLSIIPRNTLRAAGFPFGATLVQPIRYAWEMALPRKLLRRPPVLSTCWLARRDILLASGGFAAVSRSIVPESYFARVSAVQDGYSFLHTDETTGIVSAKTFAEQRATAVRTRYPQVHRRVELVMLLATAELFGILLPYILVLVALFGMLSLTLTMLSIATILMVTVAYVLIVYLTYRTWLFRTLWMPPFAVFADVLFLNYSMIRYEFFEVIWKGRNVCIPVMYSVNHDTIEQ